VVLQRDAAGLHLQVSDQGMGISPEALRFVFDRFYRAPSAQSLADTTGMGLGLFLVRQVVQGHGGSVLAENLAGGGSRFSIRLPL